MIYYFILFHVTMLPISCYHVPLVQKRSLNCVCVAAISCGPAPEVSNGRYAGDVSGPQEYPSILDVICDSGHVINNTTQECLATGLWLKPDPNCSRE